MTKVLVTGGAGYIGGHFVKLLRDETDFEIHVVDNFSQSRHNILNHPRISYHEVDIRDKSVLMGVFATTSFDAVFHFAALASVPDSVKNPAAYYDHNVIGMWNLLECMREHDVKKIVFSSSAATYGEPETEVILDSHPQRPKNPYGETKLIGEKLLRDYHVAYGLSSISFRYFCAAGADEDGEVGEYHTPETHAIPVIIETILGRRDTFYVFGDDYPTPDGSGVRDYIHVNDLARAHLLALTRLNKSEALYEQYNLGINQGFSVLELIKAAEAICGKKVSFKIAPRREGDPARLIADASRAMETLSWQPVHTDIDSMIESAYRSFKERS